jgi:phage tail tape-measure protein
VADAKIRVVADTSQAERALGKLNKNVLTLGGAARAAAGAIAAVATGGLIRSIVQTTMRFQDLRTTLNSVTGSAQKGADAFDFISKFATQTQFGVEDLTTTYIKLQTAGITPTTELLTTFTDAAAVTTDQVGSLQAITDLFSRTTAGGLGLEDLNRLVDRGLPVFDILQEI